MRQSVEVASVFRNCGYDYRKTHHGSIPPRQLRAMHAIEICRSAELGGHVDACDTCGFVRVSYNSCRNRHCPKCQYLTKEKWLEARKEDLLPIPYVHIVFTIPETLRPLALRNQKVLYTLLFKAVSETVKKSALNPKHLGAKIGCIAILHTWSQTLIDHSHIHCIVTGGGLSPDGKQWIAAKGKYFLPVKVLSRLFRGKFLHYLKKAYKSKKLAFPGTIEHLQERGHFYKLLNELYRQEWVVFSKKPFRDTSHVFNYLGRYTHRVAISNDRLVGMEDNRVTFRYRDSKRDNAKRLMTLDANEFIRRFLMHILPDGFTKIRYYGLLSNRNKKRQISHCRKLLGMPDTVIPKDKGKAGWEETLLRITGIDVRICPRCKKGTMVLIKTLLPHFGRWPP